MIKYIKFEGLVICMKELVKIITKNEEEYVEKINEFERKCWRLKQEFDDYLSYERSIAILSDSSLYMMQSYYTEKLELYKPEK